MIKGIWRKLSGIRIQGNLRVILVLLFALLLPGCLKRQEILAEIWLQSGLPADICKEHPELWEFGHYRKLNDGKYEVVPYCDPNARKYVGMREEKFNEFLDKHLPEEK